MAPPARSARARQRTTWRIALGRARARLSPRTSIVVQGVRYRPVTRDSLTRALSAKGRGHKAYDVRFPDGHSMRFECSRQRPCADLVPPRLLPIARVAEPWIRPGMRVLDFRCSTGDRADWVARRVGPAGGVLALDTDEQAIEYASHRYPAPTIAFESGGITAVAGELDASFEAVLAVEAITPEDDPAALLAELWRLLSPGGIALVAAPEEPIPRVPLARAFSATEFRALILTSCATDSHGSLEVLKTERLVRQSAVHHLAVVRSSSDQPAA